MVLDVWFACPSPAKEIKIDRYLWGQSPVKVDNKDVDLLILDKRYYSVFLKFLILTRSYS